jgi:hypothetical protein
MSYVIDRRIDGSQLMPLVLRRSFTSAYRSVRRLYQKTGLRGLGHLCHGNLTIYGQRRCARTQFCRKHRKDLVEGSSQLRSAKLPGLTEP